RPPPSPPHAFAAPAHHFKTPPPPPPAGAPPGPRPAGPDTGGPAAGGQCLGGPDPGGPDPDGPHAPGLTGRAPVDGRPVRVPMRTDTVFDLASLTKLCTALLVAGEVERGTLALDRPAARYAPELTGAAAYGITVRQLLTHTSGLRPELPLYALPSGPPGAEHAARWAAVAGEPPLTEPGGAYRYSDLNLLLLGRILERVTGHGLDRLLRERITGPLGMDRTRFRPPAAWRPAIAATEDQRAPWGKLDRGPVHGEVHDENAYALGGVAGHAGLFAPAGDLEVLCRALLGGGSHRGTRILAAESVDALLAPPGLGFAVDQGWFMGELAGRGAAGHTGFTGTSLVLDRASGGYLVLLANTVHPRRRPADNRPRAAAASWLARALGAAPPAPYSQ
ncbi:serine hydrolase domain-containing protein, partial [Streptomyces sp. HSW2009]|uniref:serine hydrolase domain-containing protein n=1 Tax=Streptomyces sp. HSW2009 TaxID=3142890 RepID=UPI0032EB3DF0